ncbi:hypothetical protein Rfer_4329 (plasmid) [Rhodoferax ferrireducens T118]|uniref:Uncharacterized protein n=1 Tax=Albidiferax ferrireducens (strain ATCC BAA-621 / DSM 15236 / T118) TaxID=338969 RepID=Q21QD0_ALBFT|nr:hypothetical protein [Rhodoferax ferrireducens]ABD72015.1 hypothetical protein Rfer_4329 [Rhodoferax ferrireducens T118]
MKTTSSAQDGGNLTTRESLWYKAQVLIILALVLAGMARGYTLMIEQGQEALRASATLSAVHLSDCLTKYSVSDQATACKKQSEEAGKTALDADTIAEKFPNKQLLDFLGSDKAQ